MANDADDFDALLDAYSVPPADLNSDYAEVQIVWVQDNPAFGAQHMLDQHGVEMHEVEEVIMEIPPVVRVKQSADHDERTLFWGATRHDRHLFVVCEDWTEDGVRYLKPITAFEPDDGENYWTRL